MIRLFLSFGQEPRRALRLLLQEALGKTAVFDLVQQALHGLAKTDNQAAVFKELLFNLVSFSRPRLELGLDYLVAKEIFSPKRKSEILT